MPTYDHFDVVVVPFPFTDRQASKRRPALVLSQPLGPAESPHYLLAMITSAANASWPQDHRIDDIRGAGLPAPSVVRMKLFTLDQQLILRKAGRLSADDSRRVSDNLKRVLPN